MNSGIARHLGRRSFLGGVGLLTLAACSGGAADILANKPPASSENPDIVIDPCPDCVPVIPQLPTELSSLSNAEVAALTAAQIAALSSDQIASFTNAQLHYITQAQAFHGSQASAVLNRVAAAQILPLPAPWEGAPGSTTSTPPPYIPPNPGAGGFWTWVAGSIGGILAGIPGVLTAGPAGYFLGVAGSIAGSTAGAFLFGPTDGVYCFYDSVNGEWFGVDLGSASDILATVGETSLDSDGVNVSGSFSASCPSGEEKRRFIESSGCTGTITITVVAN